MLVGYWLKANELSNDCDSDGETWFLGQRYVCTPDNPESDTEPDLDVKPEVKPEVKQHIYI
jgi:hypothetical protein